jgi:hypothetical protein
MLGIFSKQSKQRPSLPRNPVSDKARTLSTALYRRAMALADDDKNNKTEIHGAVISTLRGAAGGFGVGTFAVHGIDAAEIGTTFAAAAHEMNAVHHSNAPERQYGEIDEAAAVIQDVFDNLENNS